MCSSYIGYLFLQAINHVNGEPRASSFPPIEHPFGKHENLDRMDTLRLLYLLRNCGVIRFIEIPRRIQQCFVTSNDTLPQLKQKLKNSGSGFAL